LQELAFVVAHDILRVPVIIGTVTITQSAIDLRKFKSCVLKKLSLLMNVDFSI
jgi:hypothetical protein